MNNIANLKDFYTNFSVIDRDAPGGFARVWKASRQNGESPNLAAFKLMRPEVRQKISDANSNDPFEKFLSEFKTLVDLSARKKNKSNIEVLDLVTEVYDSGFIDMSSANVFLKEEIQIQNKGIKIRPTGLSVDEFSGFWKSEGKNNDWLPYLVVELAEYNDSLYRRIHRYTRDNEGIHRLPTLEAIVLTIRLLDFSNWFHSNNQVYIDWKPEHIYWNGSKWNLKLIDYNVTITLEEKPGKKKNITDDIRLLIGSALYSSLTLSEMDNQAIISKPTTNFRNPIQEIRNRYKVEKPEDLTFSSAYKYLDQDIKKILGKALTGKYYQTPQEIKNDLVEYLEKYFNLPEKIVYANIIDLEKIKNPYVAALRHIHQAKDILDEAYKIATSSLGNNENLEIERLSLAISQTRKNLPIP